MRVETERLYLYPISNDEMHSLIEKEADAEMKQVLPVLVRMKDVLSAGVCFCESIFLTF